MLVLALDTTSRPGSAALVRDGRLIGALRGDPARSHGERLPGDLAVLLGRHGLAVGDVDLFAVAAGPGSFTGLRVGMAAVQGLAFATGRPAAGVPTLEALAQVAAGWDGFTARTSARPGEILGVLMDAQRHEVFAALYRVAREAGGVGVADIAAPVPLEPVEAPVAERPEVVLARWRQSGRIPAAVAGDGAVLYREHVLAHLGSGTTIRETPALAPLVAVLAARAAAGGQVGGAASLRPVYVRRPDAEIARARAGSGDAGQAAADGSTPGQQP